jgi:hypothetical protein
VPSLRKHGLPLLRFPGPALEGGVAVVGLADRLPRDASEGAALQSFIIIIIITTNTIIIISPPTS